MKDETLNKMAIDDETWYKMARDAELCKTVIDDKVQEGLHNKVFDERGASLLHYAAWNGLKESIEKLLKNGADLNLACKNDGNTPLHDALEKLNFKENEIKAQTEAVKTILKHSASKSEVILIKLMMKVRLLFTMQLKKVIITTNS